MDSEEVEADQVEVVVVVVAAHTTTMGVMDTEIATETNAARPRVAVRRDGSGAEYSAVSSAASSATFCSRMETVRRAHAVSAAELKANVRTIRSQFVEKITR